MGRLEILQAVFRILGATSRTGTSDHEELSVKALLAVIDQ